MAAFASPFSRYRHHALQCLKLVIGGRAAGPVIDETAAGSGIVRVPALSVTGATTLTGAVTLSAGVVRTGQEYLFSGPPKAGATAGWVVNAGDNLYQATLPQSQTGSTLVLPVIGLKVGWTVTAYKISAQIESAGGAVTLDADLRKLTNAAGDPTDASVGTITQVAVTADTAVAAAKTGLTEVIAFGEWLYLLLTATTAASTDIRFLGASITVTEG